MLPWTEGCSARWPTGCGRRGHTHTSCVPSSAWAAGLSLCAKGWPPTWAPTPRFSVPGICSLCGRSRTLCLAASGLRSFITSASPEVSWYLPQVAWLVCVPRAACAGAGGPGAAAGSPRAAVGAGGRLMLRFGPCCCGTFDIGVCEPEQNAARRVTAAAAAAGAASAAAAAAAGRRGGWGGVEWGPAGWRVA